MPQEITLPLARDRSELLVERLSGELLIFDPRSQQGHCLNATAADVWERCDGRTPVAELVAEFDRAGVPEAEAVVELAIVGLEQAGLVQPAPVPTAQRDMSRRRLMRGLGLAAGAVLIQSIAAPAPALACSQTGTTVANCGLQCCSHICVDFTTGPGICQ